MLPYRVRYQNWRNRTTIRKQLSLVVGLAVSFIMALLIVFNYISQANATRQQQVTALRNLLQSEMENLDGYVKELLTHSIQLRNHQPFMDLLLTTEPFSYAQRQLLDSAFKTYFYSRSDVQQMELYMIRQESKFSLSKPVRKIMVLENADPTLLAEYPIFTAEPDYSSISPHDNGFIQVSRTIIDSPRQVPLAVVRFTSGSGFFSSLEQHHERFFESVYVFDDAGRTYYHPAHSTEEQLTILRDLAFTGKKDGVIKLDNGGVLWVVSDIGSHGLALLVTKPMDIVNSSVNATRNTSIFIGLFLLVLMVIVVLASIRLITTPLTSLSHWVRRVGTGNFSAVEALEGSYEIKGLSEDANQMTKGIQHLIDSTYVAKINERTAKLTALEAQTNPHFLFNTLQAISSQAILNHHDDIYQMVSSLAAILRYSIRGGNLDTLETELEQVRRYLFLQKTRFGDRLTFDFSVEEKILSINVPKFCMLSLAENSIIHGLRESVTDIAIHITASTDEENVVIRVSDNGYGIDAEALSRIRESLENPDLHISENIGLINLASRLRLLYGSKGRMRIESQSSLARSTSVSILIPLVVLESVQSTDH